MAREKEVDEVRKYVVEEAERRNLPPTKDSYSIILAELRKNQEKEARRIAEGPVKMLPTSFNDPAARLGIVGMGALAGGIAGAPLGPIGIAEGSALGAAGGSVLHRGAQSVENAIRSGQSPMQAIGGLVTPPSNQQELSQLGQNIATVGSEAALEGGLSIAGESVASGAGLAYRGLLRKITGLSEKAEARAMLSERFGSPLGLQDVSTSAGVQSVQPIFGVFPLLGKPWLQAARRRSDMILGSSGAAENLFNEIGPVVTYSQAGGRVIDSAELAFSVFKDEANELYLTALNSAREAGAIVPVNTTVSTSSEILGEIGTQPRLASGERREATGFENLRKVLNDAPNLDPSGMTVDEYRGFSADIISSLDKAEPGSREQALLIQLKAALEDDFANIAAPDSVKQALNAADEFYASGMQTFGSEAGQRIRRVNRQFGKTQLEVPTSRPRDEVIDAVWGADPSPGLIASMRRIMDKTPQGKEAFSLATRNRLQQRFNAALKTDQNTEIVTIDANKLRKSLGLDEKIGKRYEATKEMLKGTGVTARDLDEFIDVADNAFKLGIPNAAMFSRRRAVLSGIGGTVGLLAPGATAAAVTGGSLPVVTATVLATLWGTRKLGRLLTDPRALKNLRIALDASNSKQAQLRALRRLSLVQPSIFSAEAMAQQFGGRTSDYTDVFAGQGQSPQNLYRSSIVSDSGEFSESPSDRFNSQIQAQR